MLFIVVYKGKLLKYFSKIKIMFFIKIESIVLKFLLNKIVNLFLGKIIIKFEKLFYLILKYILRLM